MVSAGAPREAQGRSVAHRGMERQTKTCRQSEMLIDLKGPVDMCIDAQRCKIYKSPKWVVQEMHRSNTQCVATNVYQILCFL